MITSEEAAGKYDSRLRAKLEKLRPPGALEVWDAAYDEYSWIFDGKTPQGIAYSVTLHLIEEAVREGEGGGLALFLSIVQDGGQILGEWCPFNFTESLWCHKENGLARRVRMFEQLSDSSILDCLKSSGTWWDYTPRGEKQERTSKMVKSETPQSAAHKEVKLSKYIARINCEYSLLVEAVNEEQAEEIAANDTPLSEWSEAWSTIEVAKEE